jgi:hypothetical protein
MPAPAPGCGRKGEQRPSCVCVRVLRWKRVWVIVRDRRDGIRIIERGRRRYYTLKWTRSAVFQEVI